MCSSRYASLSLVLTLFAATKVVSSVVTARLLGPNSTLTPNVLPPSITASASISTNSQGIPINSCSWYNSTAGSYQWNDPWCSITAPTVQLIFWPTDFPTLTYPSTTYIASLNYTFTSPSVYMNIETLSAYNPCGPLGPSYTNLILAFDLTEISTLVPYTSANQTGSQRTRQLYLSDLDLHCKQTESIVVPTSHPLRGQDNRCNPSIVPPQAIESYGLPYWKHCGNPARKFGYFDPPYAVSADAALISTTPPPSSTTIPPTTDANSASVKQMPSSDLATSTGIPETTVPTATDPGIKSQWTQTVGTQPTGTEEPAPSTDFSLATHGQGASIPDTQPSIPAGTLHPNTVSSVVGGQETQFTDVKSNAVASPGPGGPGNTLNTQIVRLESNGLEIIDIFNLFTSTHVVPESDIVPTGVKLPPASTVVYRGQTLTLGGSAITLIGSTSVEFDGGRITASTNEINFITTTSSTSETNPISTAMNSPESVPVSGSGRMAVGILYLISIFTSFAFFML